MVRFPVQEAEFTFATRVLDPLAFGNEATKRQTRKLNIIFIFTLVRIRESRGYAGVILSLSLESTSITLSVGAECECFLHIRFVYIGIAFSGRLARRSIAEY